MSDESTAIIILRDESHFTWDHTGECHFPGARFGVLVDPRKITHLTVNCQRTRVFSVRMDRLFSLFPNLTHMEVKGDPDSTSVSAIFGNALSFHRPLYITGDFVAVHSNPCCKIIAYSKSMKLSRLNNAIVVLDWMTAAPELFPPDKIEEYKAWFSRYWKKAFSFSTYIPFLNSLQSHLLLAERMGIVFPYKAYNYWLDKLSALVGNSNYPLATDFYSQLLETRAKHYNIDEQKEKEEKASINEIMHPNSICVLSKDWKWEIKHDNNSNEDVATITKYIGKQYGFLVVPEKIGTRYVTGFHGKRCLNSSLDRTRFVYDEVISSNDAHLVTGIRFPDRITHIEQGALSGFGFTDEVILPRDLEEIPTSCFQGASFSTTLHLPSKIKFIGNSAFLLTLGLRELTIPPSCTLICTEAFSGSEIETITTQSDVEFEPFAFAGSKLQTAYLNGVSSLRSKSFLNAYMLTKIYAPDLRYISANALGNARSLSELHLKEVPRIVAKDAFPVLHPILQSNAANNHFPTIFIPEGSNVAKFRKAFSEAYRHSTGADPSTMKIVFE